MSSESTEIVVYKQDKGSNKFVKCFLLCWNYLIKLPLSYFNKIVISILLRIVSFIVWPVFDRRLLETVPSKVPYLFFHVCLFWLAFYLFFIGNSNYFRVLCAILGIGISLFCVLYAPSLKRNWFYLVIFVIVLLYPEKRGMDIFKTTFIEIPEDVYNISKQLDTEQHILVPEEAIVCDNGDCREINTREELNKFLESLKTDELNNDKNENPLKKLDETKDSVYQII